MPLLPSIPLDTLRVAFLGLAAAMLYFTGRIVLGAIPARIDRPALRALVTAGVVLTVAIVALLMDRPLVALHLPIAAATAAMTLGVASLLIGRGPPPADGSAANRSWALLAPAVAILLIGGFGGRLDAVVCTLLALYGTSATAAWRTDDIATGETKRRASIPFVIFLFVGIGVAALAAYLAMLGIPALEAARQMRSDPHATAFLIAPAIVVPLIFELLPPCRSIGWGASMSTLVKFALICLCFVLPIVAFVQADLDVVRSWSRPMTTTMPSRWPTSMPAVVFPSVPPVALRADLLVLAGASLLVVPIAGGWLRPARVEAMLLIACYLFALFLIMASSLR